MNQGYVEVKREQFARENCAECGRPLDAEPFERGADGELHHRSCLAFQAMRAKLIEAIEHFHQQRKRLRARAEKALEEIERCAARR